MGHELEMNETFNERYTQPIYLHGGDGDPCSQLKPCWEIQPI